MSRCGSAWTPRRAAADGRGAGSSAAWLVHGRAGELGPVHSAHRHRRRLTTTTWRHSATTSWHSPTPVDPARPTRKIEIYRFAGDGPPHYRHEMVTEPPYGGNPGRRQAPVATSWPLDRRGARGHDLAALAEVAVCPHVVVHPDGDALRGRLLRASTGVTSGSGNSGVPSRDLTVVDDFTSRAATSWRFAGTPRGTSHGDFLGVAPTGRSLDFTGLSMYRIEDRQDRRDLGDAEHPGHPPPAGPADRGRSPPLNSPSRRGERPLPPGGRRERDAADQHRSEPGEEGTESR